MATAYLGAGRCSDAALFSQPERGPERSVPRQAGFCSQRRSSSCSSRGAGVRLTAGCLPLRLSLLGTAETGGSLPEPALSSAGLGGRWSAHVRGLDPLPQRRLLTPGHGGLLGQTAAALGWRPLQVRSPVKPFRTLPSSRPDPPLPAVLRSALPAFCGGQAPSSADGPALKSRGRVSFVVKGPTG